MVLGFKIPEDRLGLGPAVDGQNPLIFEITLPELGLLCQTAIVLFLFAILVKYLGVYYPVWQR